MLCHRYYVTGTCSYHVTSFRVFTGSTRVISDQRGKSDISVGRFNASHWLEITIHMVCFYYYYKITDHVIILDGVIIASYDTTKESWRVFIRNWTMEGGLTIPTSLFLSRGVYSFRFPQLRPNNKTANSLLQNVKCFFSLLYISTCHFPSQFCLYRGSI